MNNEIMQYVRNRDGNRTGIMIGVKGSDNTIGIGWSKCHNSGKVHDKFDVDFGKKIAYERALKALRIGKSNNVPQSMIQNLFTFADRCSRYFKTEKTTIDNYNTN